MEKKDLITYLGFVRQMEEDVYTLERTKMQLTNKINSLGISRRFGNPPQESDSFAIVGIPLLTGAIGLIPAFIIGYLGAVFENDFKTPFFVTLIICVLIGVAIGIYEEAQDQKCYNQELEQYNGRIADDEARVAAENKEKSFLEQERNKVVSMIDGLKRDLAEAYSYGIIYGTYQNFCAVSSFYEYIASGVCESLDGPDGAMRLYRNELMQGRIIESLDKILNSLEEIKMNQATLIDAIERGNNASQKLLDATVRLSQQNDQIIKNTAIDAHNSTVMKNLNMLTWTAAGNSKW